MRLCPVISAAAMLLCSCAFAQKVVPREVLDSIAEPPVERFEGLAFERDTVDLGDIRDDAAPVAVQVRLMNSGAVPVSVTRISTSCGCTTVMYDRKAVPCGSSSAISFLYNPKGQSGSQIRKAYVYTDLSAVYPSAVLAIRVNVLPGSVPRGYPVQMGSLHCSRSSVSFILENGQERAVERIACLNGGDSPLRLAPMAGFLPSWLGFRTEPESIGAGETGDIVLTIDASALPSASGNAKVVLDGVSIRPSQRSIDIHYEKR